VRIGVMIGPERGRYASKVERLRRDARWAEEAGLAAVWIPQIPDEFDALTAATLVGAETSRIQIGTAVVPVQPRHPIALAQQALSTQAVCHGRLNLGLGVSHHWIVDEMLGLPYEYPVATMRAHLDVLDAALAGPGPVDVENDLFRVHNPLDITDIAPTPVLIAALGPDMLRLAGERTDGTILWLADERAIAAHIAPRITRAAEAAGRPAPRIVAGVPVCLCRDGEVGAAVERANRILSEAEVSPNYQRLLDRGDARDVGDILAAGSEAAIEKRLRAFADAGATDVSVRVVPLGDDRETLLASLRRTREVLGALAQTL
jgi:5,10-methylenetetrahydromethanopterin reductase